MSPTKIIGIILIVLGVAGLAMGGFTYTKDTHEAKIGPIQLSLARRFAGKPVMLRFENVAVPATMDETVFTNSRLKS